MRGVHFVPYCEPAFRTVTDELLQILYALDPASRALELGGSGKKDLWRLLRKIKTIAESSRARPVVALRPLKVARTASEAELARLRALR